MRATLAARCRWHRITSFPQSGEGERTIHPLTPQPPTGTTRGDLQKGTPMDKFTRRTASLSDSDFKQAISSETHAPIEGAEGFGCPDESRCNAHCQNNGFDRGRCDTIFALRCHCSYYR